MTTAVPAALRPALALLAPLPPALRPALPAVTVLGALLGAGAAGLPAAVAAAAAAVLVAWLAAAQQRLDRTDPVAAPPPARDGAGADAQDVHRDVGQDDAAEDEQGRVQLAAYRARRGAEQQARARAQALLDGTATAVLEELRAVAGQVEDVSGAAGGIERSVRDVDGVARGVVAKAEEADHIVGALGESLRRVRSIAELITGVAAQTRLLALNATIEAVRAGEAGAGFSVVASEVKQLADATGRSTDEITTTIAALERDAAAVSDAITAMARGIGAVGDANGALCGVADDQARAVAELTARLAEAMARVGGLAVSGEDLERRGDERVPAGVRAAVRRPGGPELPARLVDVSRGGARCRVEGVPLRGGEVVELTAVLDGRALRARCEVARTVAEGSHGLRFLGPCPEPVDAYVAAALAG